jgi:hypothetical protein
MGFASYLCISLSAWYAFLIVVSLKCEKIRSCLDCWSILQWISKTVFCIKSSSATLTEKLNVVLKYQIMSELLCEAMKLQYVSFV